MGRKYLKEIGIELKDTPWGLEWKRQEKRKMEKRKKRNRF